MKKALLVFAVALTAVFLSWSQTNGNHAKKDQLEGTWEMVSGQQLPKGTRDIKIISGGHFVWVVYETQKGKPLYTGGGTYVLNGVSYTEHVDFMSDEISAGIVGKDQSFTLHVREIHSPEQALSQMDKVCRKLGSALTDSLTPSRPAFSLIGKSDDSLAISASRRV